eukprot:gene18217-23883_t
MGNAHCLVVNKTHKKLCVVTYNHADMLYTGYKNMYIIEPGESKQVEAIPHDYGLRVGIIYDAKSEGQVLMYQRWVCKNESVLTVTFMNGGDISTFGDNTVSQGKGEFREKDTEKFASAVEALTYQSPVTRAALKR